jgi:hypothetical protein
MRTIVSFVRQNSLKRRLRMRLVAALGLLFAAVAIFALPGKTRIAHTPPPPMPGLRGEAAAEYLKHQGLYNSLCEAVKAARYDVYPSSPRQGEKLGEAFHAGNPRQRWRAGFTPDGLTLRGGEAPGARWEFGMKLRSAGYGERQIAVGAGRLNVKGPRIEYERAVGSKECGVEIARQSGDQSAISNNAQAVAAIIEWYVNKAEGLEQGFTLAAPVAERPGEEPLVLRLELTGDLRARAEADGQSVTLLRESRERALAYDHLAVVDAQGRNLPARLEAEGGEVRIMVDDRGASYPVTIDPTFSDVKKLTASDGALSDWFGQSVAIYEDTAIVGAPLDRIGSNTEQGSAYIFLRNQDVTDQWGEVKKLTASDGAAGENFGGSVAIYEGTAIVGAEGGDVGSNNNQGSAYIFERNQGGLDNWGEVKKLTASDGAAADLFGSFVAIYADTAIVGSPVDSMGNNIGQGSAYIFERNQGGLDNWGEVKKLTASDGATFDNFGGSVAIYADTAIVGAQRDDMGSNVDQGSAYIFKRNQGGLDNWGEVKKLTASDGARGDNFGSSVAIYADTVIVGASGDLFSGVSTPGSAYILERDQGGLNNWGEVKKLTASDGAGGDLFGRSVAIYEDRVIIGGDGDDIGNNMSQGSAYIFERSQGGGNNWGEVKKLTASDGATFDLFGFSVAIYADTAVVGAFNKNFGIGSAYIFFAEKTTPTISASPVTLAEAAPTTNTSIAAVSEPDQAANTLVVTVNGSTSATVNGVTVSNITVDASGEVKADLVAACGASNAGFTLRVTDSESLFAEATLDVMVTPENVAPAITLKPAISLWPPNHKYHVVTVAQMVESVSDNCSTLSIDNVVIEEVASDEPDNASDDGNTINDIVIAPDCRSVQLRAERSEASDGRVYIITLRLMDGRGNVTRQDFEVSVPIDKNGVPAVKGATALTVTGSCQ